MLISLHFRLLENWRIHVLSFKPLDYFPLIEVIYFLSEFVYFIFEEVHVPILLGPALADVLAGLYLCYFIVNLGQDYGFMQASLKIDAQVGKLVVSVFLEGTI